jgi:hypothetical protein
VKIKNQKALKVNATYQLPVYANDVHLLGSTNILKIRRTQNLRRIVIIETKS